MADVAVFFSLCSLCSLWLIYSLCLRVVPTRYTDDVKQIIAIIKPFLADKVLEELEHAPLEALEIQSVKGYGRQKNYLDQYTDSEYSQIFLPKIEIRVWVQDSRAEEVLESISRIARTGRMGDGKILVVPVLECISIQDAQPSSKRSRP